MNNAFGILVHLTQLKLKIKSIVIITRVMNTHQTHQTKHFPVSLTHDNGLGFGQGSTDGIYNQYPRGGFHRPQTKEFNMNDRRQFNNGVACDSYSCHYNPETLDDIRYHESIEYTCTTPTEKNIVSVNAKYPESADNIMQSASISHGANLLNSQINNVFLIIITIIGFFFLFSGYIF